MVRTKKPKTEQRPFIINFWSRYDHQSITDRYYIDSVTLQAESYADALSQSKKILKEYEKENRVFFDSDVYGKLIFEVTVANPNSDHKDIY